MLRGQGEGRVMSHANENGEEMGTQLEAEALSLLGRVQAGDAPLDAMLALTAFEERSDEHRAVLARVTRAWQVAGAVDPDTIVADDGGSLPPAQPAARPRVRRAWLHRSGRVRRGIGVAAAAAAAAGVAVVLIPPAPPPAPAARIFATGRGQIRTIRLDDGSRVVLGADSQVAASVAEDRRAVRLMSGQALFTVAHDASRPFVVEAGATTVRDIGTVFAVTRHPDSITIGVAEGVVEAAAPGMATVRLRAGQQVRIDRTGRGTIGASQAGAVTGWQGGLLRYRGTPLSDVVADINRYTDAPLRLADAATGRLPYSGTVRADAIGEWVTALPYAFPVTIRHRGDGVDIAARGGAVAMSDR